MWLKETLKWINKKSKDDGGTAFPTRYVNGMSLRDFFAAMALPKTLEWAMGMDNGPEEAAIGAYEIADAMIKESKREQEDSIEELPKRGM